MSGDPQIDEEIKKLTTLSVWKPGKLLSATLDPTYLSGLKQATRTMITQDLEVNQVAADFQDFLKEVLDTTGQTLRESRPYSTPFPTLANWQEKAKGLALSQLRDAIEVAEVEVERITEALGMLANSITDATKERVLDHCDSILFRRGNLTWGIRIYGESAWENYANETREKIAFLEVGKLFHEKLVQIFHGGIDDREARKPEIDQRTKAAAKLCTEAEKLVMKIHDADMRCKETNFVDFKAIKTFVSGWRRLDKLRTEFSTLRGSGVEFDDFQNTPIFPSTAGLIALEGDAARKGRIFDIFAKECAKEW
jgi:hypothetical protein